MTIRLVALFCLTTSFHVVVSQGLCGAEQDAKPNVLLLVSDDQRSDTISALGNPAIKTPNLDDLARRGSVFTRAICANPICTPSRAEILTGCSGFTTGVLDFGGNFDAKFIPFAEAMRRGGYETYYVGKWHNKGRPSGHGYDEVKGLFCGGGGKFWKEQVDAHGRPVTGYRGWIFQTDDRQLDPSKGVGLTPDISAKFADAAIEVIKRPRDAPFFLHVNFTAPHDPLLLPPGFEKAYDPAAVPLPSNFVDKHPFDTGNIDGRDEKLLPSPRTEQDVREDLAVYYAVVSHLDQQVGRILKVLDDTQQASNTIVIYTSDHGLAMGSHGLRGKQNMYEHTINVPMLMRGPGIPVGQRFAAQMYLRDLYSTVCELTNTNVPKPIDSLSVVPVLRGKQEEVHGYVYGYFRNYQRMIRGDRWKLVHYPHLDRYQLFDLKSDPAEMHDLSADAAHVETKREYAAQLRRWQKQVKDPALPSTS